MCKGGLFPGMFLQGTREMPTMFYFTALCQAIRSAWRKSLEKQHTVSPDVFCSVLCGFNDAEEYILRAAV